MLPEAILVTLICIGVLMSDGVGLVRKTRSQKRMEAELWRSTADKIVGKKT